MAVEYKLPYTGDEINRKLSEVDNKIPIPTNASVGQTIQIANVDEAGKPTAWEAVDFPSGGGGSGEWVTVFEHTTTEEVKTVQSPNISTLENAGMFYTANEMHVICDMPKSETQADVGTLSLYIYDTLYWLSGVTLFRDIPVVPDTKEAKKFVAYMEKIDNRLFGQYSYKSSNKTENGLLYAASASYDPYDTGATVMRFNATTNFPAGTIITVKMR